VTRGKYRKKKQHKRGANFAEVPIVNASSQPPNPAEVPNPAANTPEQGNHKRPRSTIGEIIMSVFVGATVLIYVILVCFSVKTMHIDERAWIGFGTVEPFDIKDRPLVIKVSLQNTGKTPGTNFRAAVDAKFIGSEDQPDLDKLIEPRMGTTDFSLLLPTGSRHYRAMAITGDVESQISGPNSIIVFGKTTYTDIFGFNHWTKYCERSVPDPIEKLKFRSCGFYSGIDSERE
jgi:hypothetical protein